jgi:hypothetical protein
MKRLAFIGVAVLAMACEGPTTPNTAILAPAKPSASVVQNDRFETSEPYVNDCNGGTINLQLEWHVVGAATEDGAGGFHLKQHINVQGFGVDDLTGVNYVVSETLNAEGNFSAGEERTFTLEFALVAKGKAPNENVSWDMHTTITPDGNVSSSSGHLRVKCQ